MELWMVSGVFVVLLALLALYGAVVALVSERSGRAAWFERWASRAALVAAGLAMVTFVLYALAA